MKLKNEKIKILYIHPTLSFGGAEVQRLALLEKWNLSKHEVSILCIEKAGEIGEEIKKLGIPVYCLNKSSKPYNIAATFSLLIFLLNNHFDIVQTCLFNANFHGRIAAFLAGVNFIFSEEHSEHYQYTSLKFLPYIWADRILSFLTSRIICCCDTLRKDIAKLEKINPRKFITILSSANLQGLTPALSGSQLRRKLNLSDSDFIIGNVGSMSPRKGHKYLLRAFSLVKNKIPNVQLIFIGREDPLVKKNLMNLVKSLNIEDSVYFLGRQKESAPYYEIMDLFVLSSLCEGIPLVILEAMQMDIPVISTNVGGVGEFIKHNETGMLISPRDINALSEGIIELIENRQKRFDLAKAAKEKCLDRFKPERYLKELEMLYAEVLNGKAYK